MGVPGRKKSELFCRLPWSDTRWPSPPSHSLCLSIRGKQPGPEGGEQLCYVRTPLLVTNRYWLVVVIPPLCFGSSHSLQTVWNSLRWKNRLTVVFQVLFSRNFVKNNLVMWARSKPPSPCFSTKPFSQVTTVCSKFHTFESRLNYKPLVLFEPRFLMGIKLG